MDNLRTFVFSQFKKHTTVKKAKTIEQLIYEQAEEHCKDSGATTFMNHVYKQKTSLILDYLIGDSQAKKSLKDGTLTECDLVKIDKKRRYPCTDAPVTDADV